MGDMIRAKIGPIEHYGIFVSEEEVIQFGHPRRDMLVANPGEDIRISACSITEFAAGSMVEVAKMNFLEQLRRFSRSKTVCRARSRMGENGYDILHNNCEHFANWCVFGKEICSQTDRIASEWSDRPMLDVYICPVGAEEDYTGGVALREKELARVTNESLRKQKSSTWKLLEYAMLRSLGKKMRDERFSVSKNGKWTCKGLYFSLSHTENWVAAAVSNRPVGVDLEEIAEFLRREPERIARLICTEEELAEQPMPEELMRLWMLKESCYKREGKGRFTPVRRAAGEKQARYLRRVPGMELALAVAGENVEKLRLYRCQDFAGAELIAADSAEERA